MAVIQLAMTYEAPARSFPAKGTQNYALLEAFLRGEYITVYDSITKYGCYRLSERVREIERLGWKISRQWKKTANDNRVLQYFINR